jgi:hypothetical protein
LSFIELLAADDLMSSLWWQGECVFFCMKPFCSMNPALSVPSFIFDARWPVGAQQNSSFPLFPWCGKSECILSITMKLLDIRLGLIISFHESSCA